MITSTLDSVKKHRGKTEWRTVPRASALGVEIIADSGAISKLCAATQQENTKNRARRSDNKSGITGVYWDKKASRWRATIHCAGKRLNLGFFDTLQEATAARKLAEKKAGFHPNHGRSTA